MIPPWLRLTLYVAAGFAAVWLLFRWWQSRRRIGASPAPAARVPTPKTARESIAPAVVAAPAQPLATAVSASESIHESPVNPPTAEPELSILKSESQSTSAELRPAPSLTSSAATFQSSIHEDAPRSTTWDRRTLLAAEAREDGLPTVLADEIPATRSDDYVFGGATSTLAALLPDSPNRYEETRRELHQAGYYQPHALQNLSAIRYLCMMGGLITAGLALILVPPRLEWMAIIGVVTLPLLGWALPRLYVRSRVAERRSEIERGLPDLLDMLNMCVSQGLTIPDSLRRILSDLRGPYPALAQELRIVTEQASIGSLTVALDNFSRRTDIPEVHSFTSLLNQTERMGTSISESLASYSDTMRESLKQRADEKGNRAAFRLLFPTVLCLMPAVYLFLLGPAIVELSNFFYSGGRDSLDRGSAVIQRINEQRQNRVGQTP